MSYPILPRQLSVVDALTIGIPGFVLSFQPSHEPARPGFIPRVLRFCVPVGVVIGLTTMTTFAVLRSTLVDADRPAAQSALTLLFSVLGLVALYELMRPLDHVRAALLIGLVALLAAAFVIGPFADFFLLQLPSAGQSVAVVIGALVGAAGIVAATRNQERLAALAAPALGRLGTPP